MVNLLVSTHSRVIDFDTETKESKVIHVGHGVYYGLVYPWVVSRANEECLLNIETGEKVLIPSVFTHDATKVGSRIIVTDCGGGGLVELQYPSMKLVRHVKPFTPKHHVNTVAIVNGDVWALLHNLGKSILVKVDMDTGAWIEQRTNVGTQSHGLAWWRDAFVILDSYGGAVLHGDTTVWKSDTKCFLKGLCVHDDIAYFGISDVTERSNRGSPSLQCEVAALNLVTGQLVWRHRIKTCGLLNALLKFPKTCEPRHSKS
jgi:hypothetical protein